MNFQRHLLPQAIHSIAHLRLFVEHHVFAVWDFMLLLKTLQQHLAPSGAPWAPPRHPNLAGLINSLVAEEECDCLPDELGGPLHLSHFAIYRRAMVEIAADTSVIDAVLVQAMAGDLPGSVRHPAIPRAARRFLRTTQDLISEGEVDALAAAFAYGRELIVPDLFRSLLDRCACSIFPAPPCAGISSDTSSSMATATARWRSRWFRPWQVRIPGPRSEFNGFDYG